MDTSEWGHAWGGPFQPLLYNRLGQGLPPMLSPVALSQDTRGSCFGCMVTLLFTRN